MNSLSTTGFEFPGQTGFYRGKVRDVYFFGDRMAMVATDRISAFDVVLPRAIPQKGAILNQLAAYFLRHTQQIVPNWIESTPDPNVSFGKVCQPVPVEMVIRGYLTGHAWRVYKQGLRLISGVEMPDGMKEYDVFSEPIITPTTKASEGHDQDISREEILGSGLVSQEVYTQMESYTRKLFGKGQEMAASRGLILADTKYEFGLINGQVFLMDEIHTPDSSRYYYQEGFGEITANGGQPRQLSKEFVRNWLIENGFMGKEGQVVPEMTDEFVNQITDRYLQLFETMTGFLPQLNLDADIAGRIEKNIFGILNRQNGKK
ncbi:MAG TPA: phosphoribosylaminoimidazolesuccinocarboxamide synthase [Catalimonadaceae bacterium]|nr:phosphoribosylaminoimidazolesuccinocarboxamide synthase [Catalimonadaceae bacterium]HPI11322.1 phosphoribosylaminoimidazolesuccinocarboxamide synthase [Catalimonadaceae bacterium]